MNHAAVELRRKSDAARERLGRQLAGMEGHLECTHAPGQWTTREVLCHLLGEPGTRLVGLLERFSATDPPLVEITPALVSHRGASRDEPGRAARRARRPGRRPAAL